ncbi:MAG: hypothetical protein ACRYGF_03235 [Janthinobacterium lividum]
MPSFLTHRFLSLVGLGLALLPHAFVLAETVSPPAKTGPATPAVSFPLETFGYRPGSSAIALRSGYTNATLSFIDSDHLLLTFSARKLMLRANDGREGDDDHTVRAQVIHLPDGRVVRETEWRLHDRAPYLWPLTDGKFLLRERGDIYSLDPLGAFHPEQLGRRMLLHSENEIESVQLSPARDLLLLETTPARQVGDDPEEKRELPVAADFFRVGLDRDGAVRLTNRGHAISHSPFSISFTSMGVLQTVKEDRLHWGFDFHTYAGKNIELAGFTSTCRPSSIFVSDAEFFAYGCRGSEDRRLMGGFNLLAEAKWVFTLDDSPLWLGISSSPSAGRFAVRNTLTTSPAQDGDRLGANDIRAQEIRVYSSREGVELLRVVCSPAQRPGGNFALSSDGLKLAVLHGPMLEIYNLPPIAPEDGKLYEREQTSLLPLRPSADLDVAVALTNGSDKSSDAP